MSVFSVVLSITLACASLLLHEAGHVFAIRYMGAQIEKIGVLPVGIVAKARGLEFLHSWERSVVYAAGPLANLGVALWAAAVSRLSYTGIVWLDELAFYNIILGVFNLLPVLPLDGGRLVLQFLGNSFGMLRANRLMPRFGIIIGLALMALGFLQLILFPFNITLLCAGYYIRRKNREIGLILQADFYRALDGKNSRLRARTLRFKEINIPAAAGVKNAFERVRGDFFAVFYLDGKKERPITEKALFEYIFTYGLAGTMKDISNADTAQ